MLNTPLFFALVAADFNNDGKLDVAGLSGFENEVSVSLGNGDGTFQNPQLYTNTGQTFPNSPWLKSGKVLAFKTL